VVGGLGAGAGEELRGIGVGGLGVRAGRRLKGVALSLVSTGAPEQTGLMLGALNGIGTDRHRVVRVSDRMTGVSVGLVNATARLRGLQLGLLNYAADNPPGLRLLPLANLHL
jgi:hypothetical protein